MKNILNEVEIVKTADFFKILSDPTRIKIINLLKVGPLTVNEISEEISLEQSALSHQLKLLKSANVVTYIKSGRNRIYRLSDEHIYTIFTQAIAHIKEKL